MNDVPRRWIDDIDGLHHPIPVESADRVAEAPSPPRRRGRIPLLNIVLFLATVLSTLYRAGWKYSFCLMCALLAHEMGHFVMCRVHGVQSSWPYFIPMPFSFFGTMGAVIKMDRNIPNRKALFDIGIAGPLAGLIVIFPILVLGIWHAEIADIREIMEQGKPQILFGDPLLFKGLSWLIHGPLPKNSTLVMGPGLYAAWVMVFVTGLNLLPIGQLDGGHIAYAVLRRHSRKVFFAAIGCLASLCYFVSTAWILIFVLALVFGFFHPPTMCDEEGIGPVRRCLAVVALAVFVLCFVPNPIQIMWPK